MTESEQKSSHQYADSGEASHIYLLHNSLTAGNLFFGFLAIMRCIEANFATDPNIINEHFTQAVWYIFFGVLCDAFDGRVARMGVLNHCSASSLTLLLMLFPLVSDRKSVV